MLKRTFVAVLFIQGLMTIPNISGLYSPALAQTSTEIPKADQEHHAPSNAEVKAEENPAFEMLQQAYYLGGQLPADEHAYQMAELVIIASRMRHPMVRQWVQELLQLTAGLPQQGLRQMTEQLALKALAAVDPAEALQMLSQLTPVTVSNPRSGSRVADVRTNAAGEIFPKYWKDNRAPDIDALRAAANYLGETGQYPFAALASILRDVRAKDALSAEMLFLDAMQYYQREQLNSFQVHVQFLELLNAGRGVVPEGMERAAVELAVDRLLKQAEEPPPKDMVYVGRIASGDGFVELHSVAEENLYKILPLVREFAPDLENRIIESRPSLTVTVPSDVGPLPEGYQESSVLMLGTADGGTVDLERNPDKKAKLIADITDQNRARHARRLADSDPETALKLANSIKDPALRASTLAAIAEGEFRETDPAQASELMVYTSGNSEKVDPTAEKVQLAVLVTQARAQSQRDDPELWDTLSRGLELAEELFQKEMNAGPHRVGYTMGPDWEGPGYIAAGFKEANVLVKIGMEKQTANTLGWLAQQRDPALKSYLLISAAEGLWNAQEAQSAKTQ